MKSKFILKECKKHGETAFVLEGRGYYRCKQCRSDHVSERRRNVKEELIKIHGGKCKRCGYNKSNRALHFHHLDPILKSFGIGNNGFTRSLKKSLKESMKCLLLCSNCHCELEDKILLLGSSIGSSDVLLTRGL